MYARLSRGVKQSSALFALLLPQMSFPAPVSLRRSTFVQSAYLNIEPPQPLLRALASTVLAPALLSINPFHNYAITAIMQYLRGKKFGCVLLKTAALSSALNV